MQIVKPIDIADALRVDLSSIIDGARFMCTPIPPDLSAGDVVIESLGGTSASAASDVYDVTVGVYAATEAEAVDMANEINGVIASLPLRDTSTQYSSAATRKPYADHDPRAPQLARQSFRASIICPGIRIEI